MTVLKRQSRDYRYYGFLMISTAVYAVHLFSFTLVDAFSTFSNDAAGYVLVARKWSPFFTPSPAELFSWPVHTYPPAFAALLAWTGASESLWGAHLLVSICMLVGVGLFGLWIRLQVDRITAGALFLASLAMPGVIIHSFGILSENLYLVCSLAALLVYWNINKTQNPRPGLYTALFLLLVGSILTRTAGISLAAAILVVPLLDRNLARSHRVALPVLALASLGIWQLWEWIQPYKSHLSYGYYLDGRFGSGSPELSIILMSTLQETARHALAMAAAWNHYFFRNDQSGWYFLAYYFTLIFSLLGLALRVRQLRIDAVYVLFYIGLILLWGFPDQMSRFLHPVAFLMLAQPFIYFWEQGRNERQEWAPKALAALACVILVHLVVVQLSLVKARGDARENLLQVVHSYDYYARPEGERSTGLAVVYSDIMDLMKQSADLVPKDAVVAVVKPENYTILADRKAVFLTARVSHDQQLCNLKVAGASAVFISNLTSPLNLLGPKLLSEYEYIASDVHRLTTRNDSEIAYLLLLEPDMLDWALSSSGYECKEYREME